MPRKKKADSDIVPLSQFIDPQPRKLIDLWKLGAHCKHVTLHSPVPKVKNAQPVNEFCLEGRDAKYIVDSIVYTPHGVIISVLSDTQIIPLGNVVVARLV